MKFKSHISRPLRIHIEEISPTLSASRLMTISLITMFPYLIMVQSCLSNSVIIFNHRYVFLTLVRQGHKFYNGHNLPGTSLNPRKVGSAVLH